MKIIFSEENSNPSWFKGFFIFYSIVGFLSLYSFNEQYLSGAEWFVYISNFFGEFFPVVKLSEKITSFPNAHVLYIISMIFVLIFSVIYVFLSPHKIFISAFDKINLIRVVAIFSGSLLLFFTIMYVVYFDGFLSVNADISRARIVDLLMNGSKIGMSLCGAVLFDVALLSFYMAFMSILMIFLKYFSKEGKI